MALPVDGHQAIGVGVRAGRVAELAAKSRLPAIFSDDSTYEAGGLMAYYPSGTDLYRRSASYIDKILKGANPADLPVGLPKKIDLLINLKAAQQIGLTIPQVVLNRADKVIKRGAKRLKRRLPFSPLKKESQYFRNQ
jgi:putative ABC transport system substrate-binding protein